MTTILDDSMGFGRWLKRRRQALDLTQDELAERVNCAASTLQKIEQGVRRPSRDMVERLAEVLGVPPEEHARLMRMARAPVPLPSVEPRRDAGSLAQAGQEAPPEDVAAPVESAAAPHAAGRSALHAPPMLLTKIVPPPLRRQMVPRPRLAARIGHEHGAAVTLVVAPAGWGKTTLLSAWTASLPREAGTVAWVALDQDDTDVTRLLHYIIAALQREHPSLGGAAVDLLNTPEPPVEAVLTLVLNDVIRLGERLTLVLDDYHLVRAPAIHRALTYLIEHLPPNLCLLIATREDPPLPLARLRARQDLHEIRAADLRFSAEESAVFFADVMGLAVTEQELAALEQRTEGWIAGLQLAALALRERTDHAGFIRSFTGNHRLVLDYLAEEVLAQLPAHLHDFLLQTSILDRLCGALCDAVMGIGDPTAGLQPLTADSYSQLILDELERANLFVVPLDDGRTWYRYHHLFGAVLRERLRRGASPATVIALHARAAAWHAAQGLWQAAFNHALVAQQPDLAAQAVLQLGDDLVTQGAFGVLRDYIEALPEAVRAAHPRLLLLHGICALRDFNARGARSSLEQAAAAYAAAGDAAGQGEALVHLADCLRTISDFPAAQASLRQALAAELPPRPRLSALVSLAWEALAGGDGAQVSAALDEALALVEASDDRWLRFELAINVHIVLLTAPGVVAWAERLGTAAQSWPEPACSPVRAITARIDGFVHLFRGDLAASAAKTTESMEIAAHFGEISRLGFDADTCRALVATIAEGPAAADQRMTALFTRLSQPEFADHMRAWGAVYRYSLGWLRWQQGRLDEARAILREMEAATGPDEWPTCDCARLLLRGLLAIADGDTAGAEELLRAGAAEQQRRPDALVMGDARLILAYSLLRTDRPDEALALVAATLDEQAHRPGVVLIPGALIVAPLLRLAIASKVHAQLASRLLREFPDTPDSAASQTALAGTAPSPDELSAREREVLRLIAGGAANAEIAEHLVISMATVKKHINNIFAKLDVQSRTQALVRARERNLL